jgi:hypothetical protein
LKASDRTTIQVRYWKNREQRQNLVVELST